MKRTVFAGLTAMLILSTAVTAQAAHTHEYITERCNHKITMLKPIPKNKKIKMILNCKRKSVYSFLLLFILF